MKKVALLTISILVFGCGGESSAPAASETATATTSEPAASAPVDNAALIAEGKQLFESTAICFTCHGMDAMGTALAPNLTDETWLNIEAPATVEKVSSIVKNGVAEPKEHPAPMPAMANLTEEQINAVATYVVSLGA